MRNSNKAFTLVELIVVITILGILGTIAFISLQGYSQDAKNAKVGSDIAQIVQKIAAETSKNNIVLADTVTENSNYLLDSGKTANSGTTLTGGENYDAGEINYKKLGIKEEDFKFRGRDGEMHPYIGGWVVDGDFVTYEVAGNTLDQAGNETVVLKGNYYKVADSDTAGLITESGSSDLATNNAKVKLY